jgi:hypothetical protein
MMVAVELIHSAAEECQRFRLSSAMALALPFYFFPSAIEIDPSIWREEIGNRNRLVNFGSKLNSTPRFGGFKLNSTSRFGGFKLNSTPRFGGKVHPHASRMHPPHARCHIHIHFHLHTIQYQQISTCSFRRTKRAIK